MTNRSPGYRTGKKCNGCSNKRNNGGVSRLMLAIEIGQYLPELSINHPQSGSDQQTGPVQGSDDFLQHAHNRGSQ
jgi:hypothetical protein